MPRLGQVQDHYPRTSGGGYQVGKFGPPAQTMNAERSQLAVAAARTRRSARSREFTVDLLSQADQVDLPGVGLALPALHRSAGPSVGAASPLLPPTYCGLAKCCHACQCGPGYDAALAARPR